MFGEMREPVQQLETPTPAGNDMPMVRFVGVQKSYDGRTLVVKDLNLDVARGEFLTMLGPSGSGKTTSLMMLAGFEPATSGEIYLGDRPISRVPPHKRGIGVVFQNYALFPHMTVQENLAFPLQMRRMGKPEQGERIRRALEMVEMSEYGGRRPLQLSGGQQQRVAVARALVFEPELILMDEPLGALDKQLREQMQYEIKHLHDRLGITIVYVTHDQSEALTMSDRVAVFNDGTIQQLAEPKELYERPSNAFVAQFIGENNKLFGSIREFESPGNCKVALEDGTLIHANPVNVSRIGERTLLSIRPERIILEPDAPFDNVLQAEIRELIYLGDHIRIRLKVADQESFIAKLPNSRQQEQLNVGSMIKVGWASDDCHALDDPGQRR